ncbi:poly(ADP-ribose) glycohydrolase isoform X2 [Acanthopagrus latus]|nr:poly(ADP-ribose) glycohydrolase isoform X2 [Acanthopagrus latus]XP_036974288.1 poly(ADP-ribose) glycohydrolase isoform X2 [Acanthopagrus latus]
MSDKPHCRNDSSQVRDLMQFQYADKSDKSDQQDMTKKPKENSSRDGGSSSSSSCTATSSSPCCASSPSTSRAVGHEKRDKRDDGSSSCCKLDDLKRLPQCNRQLGLLDFSTTHTVLVDVDSFNKGDGLRPQRGRDMWNNNFVKMPSSEASSAIVKTGFPKMPTKVKRWDEIQKHLKGLTKKTTVSVKDVEEAITKCNPTYKDQWSFDALSSFVKCIPKEENYFPALFPKIAKLALKLPDYVGKAIPLLQRGRPASITLSQVQISCLLANAFFCTFPHRNTTNPTAEYHNYPSINFSSLFGKWSERKREKLRAIMHYFNVVTDERSRLTGLVTFERRCLRDTDISTWRNCKETMHKLHVASDGAIETEGTGMLQVDFACNMIGGGVLGAGLVQEEILFLINPELIVSRLFTERLEDNECLIITGSQQFSCYTGFSDTFEWAGPYEDHLPSDKWGRKQRQILAIDALHFKHSWQQYSMRMVIRELNKVYCGFKADGSDEPDIATGKWGCGAFNGDPQLKAMIQLMAAAKARRGLAFFTFGDYLLKRDLEQIHHLLVKEGTTVGKLFGLLEDYCSDQHRGPHVDLFEFIRNHYRPSKSHL